MAAADDPGEHATLRRERDLYLRLLHLARQSSLEPFLAEALALVVELVGARLGYLELRDALDRTGDRCWWIAHGLEGEALETVRAAVSRGIIAEAVASGQTIVTPSALLDPRFSQRESVQVSQIEAVLCAPVGDDPPLGVVYLQGRALPGMFDADDRAHVELFAAHLAPLADRLLAACRHGSDDSTAALRARWRLDGVVGRSPALARALEQAMLVAPLDVTVLLTGESGTGKTQLAQVIHRNGPRADGPFVEVNCAALPEQLVESELFGAMPGAHSAVGGRRMSGRVEAADGGTLLLDEVGELPLPAQAKLLQFLQSRQYFPLGSPKPLQADVRVIAATNTDLEQALAERRLREDLFYRLQVMPIRMPSLAERRTDVPELLDALCAEACRRNRLPSLACSPEAARAATAAEWPGNVRQLANAVEAAAIRAAGQGARQIGRRHLFPGSPGASDAAGESPTFQEATRRFQARLLADGLDATGWNVSEAARRLDLTRAHVYNLIRAFGLKRGG